MAYQFPLNGGRINASVGGNSTSAGAGYSLVSTGTLLLAGGNNITLSQNGSAITISGANAPGASIKISAGANSASLSAVTFADGNGVSFGLNAGTITGSHNALTSQSGQALSGSNGSFAFQTATFGNLNGLSFYTSNGSLVGSYTVPSVPAQTNQTLGLYATGAQTIGQSSSNTMDARSFNISGQGAISAGLSGSTLQISAPVQSVQTQNMVSVLGSSGNISFANGNNVTFGGNASTVTASASFNQTAQTLGIYATGANTTGQSSSNTVDARSFSISAQGGLYAGMSGNTLQLSAATNYAASNHSHGNPTLNLTNLSGTTASASNGLTISLSAAAAGGAGFALYDGANSISSGTARVSAGGALTASINGQTLSINAPAQSSLSATGALSISNNGNTISIGVPVQSNQTQGFTAGTTNGANTSLTSTGTFDARSLYLNAHGAISAGFSNSSLFISAPVQTSFSLSGNGITFNTNGSTVSASVATTYAASNHSHGNPTLNLTNLSGTTASASNGLTISLSAAAPGAGAGLSAGTQSVSTGTVNFANSNGITFGMSGSNQITASHNGITSQTNQNMSLYALGNTTQNSSTLLNASNLSFNGLGAATMGYSNGSIQVSVPVQTVQTQNMVSIAGSTGNIVFGDANNITFGENASTITASASFNQTNQNMSLYALGNTTQNSSTLLNASNLSFNGLGGVTVGYSNGSIQISGGAGGGGGGGVALNGGGTTYTSGTVNFNVSGALTLTNSTAGGGGQSYNISAPAVSTLSATGAVSMSTNGSVVSIGAPSNGTVSNWEPQPLQYASLNTVAASVLSSNSVFIYKLQPEAYVNASQLLYLASISNATTAASTNSVAISLYAGIYSVNASSLSLITQSSGTQTYGWSNSSQGTVSYNGLKGLSVPINFSASPGNYWLGFLQKTASTGAAGNFSMSNYVFTNTVTTTFAGLPGQQANATQGIQEGIGVYTSATAALPTVIPMGSIIQSVIRPMPYMAFKNTTW